MDGNISLGSIAIWDTSSNMHKSQKKIEKHHPDYLLILSQVDSTSYNAVPCWVNNPGNTLCIIATPHNLYVDAKKIVIVHFDNLRACQDYIISDVNDTLRRIKTKNCEIRAAKHSAKSERAKRRKQAIAKKEEERRKEREKKRIIIKTYSWEYELAVINNDTKRMKEIEKIVGTDPRSMQPGVKSGSNLKRVTNPKPCIGGRVSPK
ncbi:MAG: hypothetical protein SOY30_13135 [Eubacteriales bacterium]|nr:hypothetical protein [Eubacteriales bacterium]